MQSALALQPPLSYHEGMKKGKKLMRTCTQKERKKEIQMIESQLDGWIRTDGQTDR